MILGARGRFGQAAALAFAAAGWRVLALVRPGANVPAALQAHARVQWLALDLYDTEGIVAAAGSQGVDVVVHALSPTYTNAAWRQQVLPLAEAAVAVARRLNALLMVPGNVYNFGVDQPPQLHEDTPQRATTLKGRLRIAMEALLQHSGVRSVVIRAGNFFGAGEGNWFDLVMVKNLRQGVLTYPGAHDTFTPWAYLPDLAASFVAVARQRTRLAPFTVLHFAGHSVSVRQWQQALSVVARERGWIAPTQDVRLKAFAWPVLRLLSWCVPTWASLCEMRYLWDTPHTLSQDRLTALVGPLPQTPFEQAVRSALG